MENRSAGLDFKAAPTSILIEVSGLLTSWATPAARSATPIKSIPVAKGDPETGAILFRTTSYFLERLGLARLTDLPDLVAFLPDHLDEELDGHAVG